MAEVISLDVRQAVKRSQRTRQEYADRVYCSFHTLRDYLYRGKMPGWSVAYHMAFETPGGLRLYGPRGPVRIAPEPQMPPPATPAALPVPAAEPVDARGRAA